jgi:hypothetical protein
LPEDQFRLYAVSAGFPELLSGQVPWQAGVYHCRWGTDEVRVVVAGQLPRAAQNAPLHLFSASPELVGFGRSAYQRRSENTSGVLGQLLERFQGEGFAMSFTMEDFQRQYAREHFARLTPEEQREALEGLPPPGTAGVAAVRGAVGGLVSGANSAIPEKVDLRPVRRTPQAAAEEVTQ